MSMGEKQTRAAAGAGDCCHEDFSDDSSELKDSYRPRKKSDYESNSNDEIVVRQGKGNRDRRPVVPSYRVHQVQAMMMTKVL